MSGFAKKARFLDETTYSEKERVQSNASMKTEQKT
jgi:hypothetical protein